MSAGRRRGAQALAFVAAMALLCAAVVLLAAPRQQLRPYDGAPPLIPHPVAALGRQDCLSCHQRGLRLPKEGGGAGALAPVAPHPERVNCQQCHVEQAADAGRFGAGNTFVGMRNEARGPRMHPFAPPAMPHPLHERGRCTSCHGELGGSPISTPHPERVNCQQCHVEQRTQDTFLHEGRP
jgi:cytochrome c-type protein NapB